MKVGIVGAGGMGGVHARAYAAMPDVELHGFDRHSERTAAIGANSAESLDQLLSTVDVVDICLPTDLHEEVALKAIKLKLPVFCEKPLARTEESARRIMDAAVAAGVSVGVGQVVRFFPEFRRAHDLVMGGAVGKPAAIRTHRGGSAPTGSDSWFMDHARSGGVLVDLAIHDFDWIRWTFGEVASVFSQSVGASEGSGPDYAQTLLSLSSGAVAHVESTWLDPAGFSTTFEVAGSEGLLAYDSRKAASLVVTKPGSARYESNFISDEDPYYRELRGFIDAVSQGEPPPVGIEEGFHSLAISLAALESAQTRKPVSPAKL